MLYYSVSHAIIHSLHAIIVYSLFLLKKRLTVDIAGIIAIIVKINIFIVLLL